MLYYWMVICAQSIVQGATILPISLFLLYLLVITFVIYLDHHSTTNYQYYYSIIELLNIHYYYIGSND